MQLLKAGACRSGAPTVTRLGIFRLADAGQHAAHEVFDVIEGAAGADF